MSTNNVNKTNYIVDMMWLNQHQDAIGEGPLADFSGFLSVIGMQ